MKAYRINPYDRTVEVVENAKGWPLAAMYDAMRRPDGAFTGVGSMSLSRTERVWVDDEGLLEPGIPVFSLRGAEYPLAGIALCLGLDADGDNAAPEYPIEVIRSNVMWTDDETTGDLEPSRDEFQDHPVLGRIPVHIVGGPILRKREA